jgi:di/tricarboxylate transporter
VGAELSDSEVIFAIIAAMVGLFIWGRLSVMMVALTVPLTLSLPLGQTFPGFCETVIIFVASLFIVAAGLEAAGVPAWVGQRLSRAVGSGPLKLSLFT